VSDICLQLGLRVQSAVTGTLAMQENLRVGTKVIQDIHDNSAKNDARKTEL